VNSCIETIHDCHVLLYVGMSCSGTIECHCYVLCHALLNVEMSCGGTIECHCHVLLHVGMSCSGTIECHCHVVMTCSGIIVLLHELVGFFVVFLSCCILYLVYDLIINNCHVLLHVGISCIGIFEYPFLI